MPEPVAIFAVPEPGRPPLLHVQMAARQPAIDRKWGWCPADSTELDWSTERRELRCPNCAAVWPVPAAVFLPLEGDYRTPDGHPWGNA